MSCVEAEKLTQFLDYQMQQRLGNTNPNLQTQTTIEVFPQQASVLQEFLSQEKTRFLSQPEINGSRLGQAVLIATLAPVYRDYSVTETAQITQYTDDCRDQLSAYWCPQTHSHILSEVITPAMASTVDSQAELKSLGVDSTDLTLIPSVKTIYSTAVRAWSSTPDPYADSHNPINTAENFYTAYPDHNLVINPVSDVIRTRLYAHTLPAFSQSLSRLTNKAQRAKLSLWDYDGASKPEGVNCHSLDVPLDLSKSTTVLDELLRFTANTPDGHLRYAAVHLLTSHREWQLLLNNKHLNKADYLAGLLLRANGSAQYIGVPLEVVSGLGGNATTIAKEIRALKSK